MHALLPSPAAAARRAARCLVPLATRALPRPPTLCMQPLTSHASPPLECLLIGSIGGSAQQGTFAMPASAAAASAASRTGQERASLAAFRCVDQGALPSGAVSVCICTDGGDGCRDDDGEPVYQEKIWWERDASGKLHFVTYPHGNCGNFFRPCIRDGDKFRILTKQEVPQTSANTANKWIKARMAAAGASS